MGAGPPAIFDERPTAPTRWPLVGRYEQIEEFEAALFTDDCDGLFLVGEAGVGKTRLAEHCRQEAVRRGLRTARAAASRTAANTPLAAMAHLLPEPATTTVGAAEPATLFRDAVRALGGDGSEGNGTDGGRAARLVLVVDDVHLLDGTSLVLLAQLLATGTVFLLGTMRNNTAVPDGLRALQRTDRIPRVDVRPLIRPDVATVLHLGLGAPVDAVVEDGLWRLTQGNPLALREAVRGAQAAGTLTLRGGAWRADGPLRVSGRALDLVRDTVQALQPEAREVLQILALCQPVGLAELELIADIGHLDPLESAGLLVVEPDGSRNTVTLAHPMYADALSADLTVTRRRQLMRSAAERLAQVGARRRSDVLRLTQWQLVAGVVPAGEMLLSAARLARFAQDFDVVETLSRVAWRDLGLPEGAVLLGEALSESGRFPLAETVLCDGQLTTGLSDQVRTDLALVRATNLFRGLYDPRTAIRVLRDTQLALGSDGEECGALLQLREAWILLMNGDLNAASHAMQGLDAPQTPKVAAARAFVDGPLHIFSGQLAAGKKAARSGHAASRAVGDPVASLHPGLHVIHEVLAAAEAGELQAASDVATAVHASLVGEGAVAARIWTLATMGRISLHLGRTSSAQRQFTDALALADAHDFQGPIRTALNGLALAHGLRDEATEAQRAVKQLDTLTGEFGFLAPEHFLGRAWAAQTDAQPERARELLRDGAALARATGHVISEAWLLQDLARLGDLSGAPRLTELAAGSDSALLAARARHVEALQARSAQRLAAAAEAFSDIGAQLLAAEAAVAAAAAAAAAGDGRAASALRAKAAGHAALTEGAATPGLHVPGGPAPLTSREREIGTLAAAGLSSRDIADRLFLSPRTVDNHLQRIFTKLGVGRRGDLAVALGPCVESINEVR